MTELTAKDIAMLKRIGRDIAALKQAQKNLSRKPQLASSSIESGALGMYDDSGTLRGQIGQQFDGTYTTSSMNGPIPPTPTGFGVVGHAGFLDVTWYGQFKAPSDDPTAIVVAPQDWARAEVHIGASQDFTPEIGPGSATRKASIESPAGASGAVLLDPGDYWVKLVTITQSGMPSAPSAGLEGTVTQPTSQGDLADLQQAQGDLLSSVSNNSDAIDTQGATIAQNYTDFVNFQGATNDTLGTLQPAFDVLSGLGAAGVDEDYFWVGDDPALSTLKQVQISTFFQAALGDADGKSIAADLGLVSAVDMGDIEMNSTDTPMTTFYNQFTAAGLSALPWNA